MIPAKPSAAWARLECGRGGLAAGRILDTRELKECGMLCRRTVGPSFLSRELSFLDRDVLIVLA